MQIAITGGSGGIGRAVIKLALAQGHRAVSIDAAQPPADTTPASVPFIQTDITDYASVEQALRGCDAVVHLAAIPRPVGHPDHEVHNNNVVGSYNVLRAAAQLDIKRVCQASSVNAIGGSYSRWPRYDYLPLDEQHPTYAEDPYSLSKWICEEQADAFARRYEMTLASLRFHWVVPDRATALRSYQRGHAGGTKGLWGYTCVAAAAQACLLSLTAPFKGHERFYIVAPQTGVAATSSRELAQEFYPDVPVRGDLSGNRGFYDCSKAERLLGWKHDDYCDAD